MPTVRFQEPDVESSRSFSITANDGKRPIPAVSGAWEQTGAAGNSDLGSFGQGEGILDINAQIADGALNLGVAKQDLDRTQIASLFLSRRR